jgi:hypothetical protein
MLAAAVTLLAIFTAIGMLLSAAVGRAPTGAGFHRLSLWIALAFLALGLGFRLSPWVAALPPLSFAAAALYAVAFVAAVIFVARYSTRPQARPFFWIDLATLAGLAAVIADPALRGWQEGIGIAAAGLYGLGLLAIPPALGGVLYAMLLAHWYLIEPRLTTVPLRRVLVMFALAELVKLVLIAGVFMVHWPDWTAAEGGLLRAFTLGNALFIAMRLFLGVLAPLALSWMTWKTVEIRSIQSATGILYAAVVFVLFGEVISAFLSVSTGLPY